MSTRNYWWLVWLIRNYGNENIKVTKRVLLTDEDLLKGEKRLCLKQENDLIYIENKVKTKITPNPNVTMKSLMINRRETWDITQTV